LFYDLVRQSKKVGFVAIEILGQTGPRALEAAGRCLWYDESRLLTPKLHQAAPAVKNPGEPAMNRDLFESKWKQIRSQTTAWWSLMGDQDLVKVDKAEIKLDKYVTMLRVKYGYTSDQAKKELIKRVTKFEAERKG
jgi:hypothetical protein